MGLDPAVFFPVTSCLSVLSQARDREPSALSAAPVMGLLPYLGIRGPSMTEVTLHHGMVSQQSEPSGEGDH